MKLTYNVLVQVCTQVILFNVLFSSVDENDIVAEDLRCKQGYKQRFSPDVIPTFMKKSSVVVFTNL